MANRVLGQPFLRLFRHEVLPEVLDQWPFFCRKSSEGHLQDFADQDYCWSFISIDYWHRRLLLDQRTLYHGNVLCLLQNFYASDDKCVRNAGPRHHAFLWAGFPTIFNLETIQQQPARLLRSQAG